MIQPYQYHLLNHRGSSREQDQWEANKIKAGKRFERVPSGRKTTGLVGNDFINQEKVIMPET